MQKNNKYIKKKTKVFKNSNKVADNTKAGSLGLVKVIHDSVVEWTEYGTVAILDRKRHCWRQTQIKKKKPPTDHFHTSDIYLERGIGISPHLSLSPPLEVRYLQQSEKTLASPIDKVQMVLC